MDFLLSKILPFSFSPNTDAMMHLLSAPVKTTYHSSLWFPLISFNPWSFRSSPKCHCHMGTRFDGLMVVVELMVISHPLLRSTNMIKGLLSFSTLYAMFPAYSPWKSSVILKMRRCGGVVCTALLYRNMYCYFKI